MRVHGEFGFVPRLSAAMFGDQFSDGGSLALLGDRALNGNRQLRIGAWQDRGFGPDEVRQWWSHDITRLSEALEWRASGFDAGGAGAWKRMAFVPFDAGEWVAADFDVRTAATWNREAFDAEAAAMWRDEGFSIGDAVAWRKRAFESGDAAAWRRAGHSPLEAAESRGAGKGAP